MPRVPKGHAAPVNHRKIQKRSKRLVDLLGRLTEVPKEWLHYVDEDHEKLLPLPCNSYESLMGYWQEALKWRQDMDDVLSIMLAVVASTVQTGDQLFLMVVGNASGGKSQFCDALTISEYCYQLEHLTGFFSGFQDAEGNDYSLINRVDRTCMVTSEGDVLMSNPSFIQIMAQQRRVFDGTATASYKNLREDRVYSSLRLTWIIAGTPVMMEKEQASLGDRFLKVFLESPPDDIKREILKHISRAAWGAVKVVAEEEGSISNPAMQAAQQRTSGYVDWLREHTDLLKAIECDQKYFDQCEDLAFLIAILRARPSRDEETPATVEEPNRLNHQFVRLMGCLSLVLNRTEVDEEVMRRVRKVAFDTGNGIVLDIIEVLYEVEPGECISIKAIALYIDRTDVVVRKILQFLRKVGVTALSTDGTGEGRTKKAQLWKLTRSMTELCDRVWKQGE